MSRPRKPPAEALVKHEPAPLDQRLGEVDLNDVAACAILLDDIRQFEAQLASAKQRLTSAIVERGKVDGETSYDLPNRMRAEIKSGKRNTIAADVLETKLREAGMPEDRISEIVVQEVIAPGRRQGGQERRLREPRVRRGARGRDHDPRGAAVRHDQEALMTETVDQRNRASRARASATATCIEIAERLAVRAEYHADEHLYGRSSDCLSIAFRLVRIAALLDRPDIIRSHTEIR